MSELSTELAQLTEGDITAEDQMIRQEQDFIPLSPDEWALLKSLETTVVAGGEALIEIRDKKLYRSTEDGKPQTWEEYCRRFCNKSKQYIDKMIRAAEVKRQLTETKVSVPVESVSHLEAMHGLSSNEIVEVAETATEAAKQENRKPTTNDYRHARAKVGKSKQGKRKPESNSKNNSRPANPHNNRNTDTKPKEPRLRYFSVVVEVVSDVGQIREINEQLGRPLTEKKNIKPITLEGQVTSDQRQKLLKEIEYMGVPMKLILPESK